eukprot:CAMPEP_0117021372 /NCGR_PEP_ID=MMETSP0472-20121206/16124_1 /TAXON_ID=693140 ORGANISM="Tiarina fusus, Strain LIS" /NCGR_SAMPLE_ID=MMETSP0472 /ASSEMBLY_ACC=CAM_ASM_000603 /LENGTH=730 /DNA_ID=CAMNT_0004726819 /DNA_START=20 /DNA_END=2212 /DNA_ORIENTATION=-
MNDRFRSFDFDRFGSAYQAPAANACVQGQQHYMTNNGPCSETYDPNRMMDPLRMPTYNSTGAGIAGSFQNGSGTRQPYLAPGGSVMSVSSPAPGMQMQGVTDFEPIPLSKDALRRINPNHPALQQAGITADVIENELRRRGELGDSTVMPDPFSQGSSNFVKPPYVEHKPVKDAWLDEIEMKVSGLSLEPMKGPEVLRRVEDRTKEVLTRYLPCVDFLVACQQELRRGLAAATSKKLVNRTFRDSMTPRQFYNSYIADLPRRFCRKNQKLMKQEDLSAAVKELQKLCSDAKAVESQGCEIVKNTFLGGMKDGESWGLRKWLSKFGGALHICNDCECILNACQKLDRSLDSTRKLSAKMRPLSKKVLTKLKSDVPASYQEQSSAHPYLPFFHRLEACLRGMSTFDPEDDDVICIDDDDEVEAIKAKPPPPRAKSRKRKGAGTPTNSAPKRQACAAKVSNSDDDSVIEILDVKPASRAKLAKGANTENDDAQYMQDLLKAFDEDDSSTGDMFADLAFDQADVENKDARDSLDLATDVDRLAAMFDQNQYMLIRPKNIGAASFWDDAAKYSSALRLFSEILRTPDSAAYLDSIDEQNLIDNGQPAYTSVIKNPLCFRDIFCALIAGPSGPDTQVSGNDGLLHGDGLSSWNMWRGSDLLQAIDLVFLNSLAYGKAAEEGRSVNRSNANKLRKLFWAGIRRVIDSNLGVHEVEQRRKCTPTRRGESSGFVVYKDR